MDVLDQLKNISETDRTKIELVKHLQARLYMTDYYAHVTENLGLDFDQIKDPEVMNCLYLVGDVVNDWLATRHLQRVRRNLLICEPRECCKSVGVTTSLPSYVHMHGTEMACAIMSAEFEKMGKKFSAAARQHWESKDNKLNAIFGPYHNPKRKWSDDRMVTAARQKLYRPDPTLSVFSVETGATSGHFDLFIMDDPTTEALMVKHGDRWNQKVWKQYVDLDTVVRKDGLLVVVLTRYSEGDLVGQIIENEIKPAVRNAVLLGAPKGELPDNFDDEWYKYGKYAGWDIVWRQALTTDESGVETPCFPEIWPIERIQSVRSKGVAGETFFASQLQNTPSKRKDNPVKQEMVDRCQLEWDDIPKQAFSYLTMQMDTAWKDDEAYLRQSGDWNVIQIWAHWQGNVYLVWAWHGLVMEHQFMDQFVRGLQWAKAHDSRIAICTYDKPRGGQGTNKTRFMTAAHAAGENCPRLIEIPRSGGMTGKNQKTRNILNEIGYLQDGRVHVLKGLEGNQELFYEWLHIGYSPHDDHADTAKDVFHEDVYLGFGVATGAPTERRHDRWEPAMGMAPGRALDDDDIRIVEGGKLQFGTPPEDKEKWRPAV